MPYGFATLERYTSNTEGVLPIVHGDKGAPTTEAALKAFGVFPAFGRTCSDK